MAVILSTAARNAACDAVSALVDVSGPGTIEIKSAASTVAGTNEVATVTFAATAFGAASVGVCTAAAITGDASAAGGTAGFATFFDGNGLAVLQCTVGSGSGDIDLSSVTIAATDTVNITALTLTQPA